MNALAARRWSMSAMLVAGGWLAALTGMARASESPTIATVTAPALRSGLILHPQQVLHIPFALKVDGPDPFLVKAVSKSCRCLGATTAPDTLPPGAIVPFAMEIVGFRDPGRMEGTIRIEGSIAGKASLLACSFTGEVLDYLEWPWDGVVVDLGRRAIAESAHSWSFEFGRGAHPQQWDRLAVEVIDSSRTFSASIVAADAGRWRLTIASAQTRFMGVVGARLRWSFWTGAEQSAYHPERTIRLIVEGPVIAKPAAILFGGLRVGEAAEREIRVEARSGPAPVIVAVRHADQERVRVDLAEGSASVRFRFSADARLGDASGHLDCELASGDVIRVPYYVAVAEAVPAPAR